ncbi:hypothetical protein FD723_39825 (plasmid) [Nostoc sp. C052]|uniref:hypothetical protein n=1 Tax=Nostoc sp. C052 TaxID=2576902 RepID=UPI0015C3DBDA|nr:hypothetical protein [Nostoc sp. C052]QLE46362.1 hypothetical protein FD723_39825 [Nostoc sp. C052]
MAVAQNIGFYDFKETDTLLQASTNLNGFSVNMNYDDEIQDYRRMETKLWQLILAGNKKPAAAPTVRKVIKDRRAKIGFVNRNDLSDSQSNIKNDLRRNFDDPGQEVKAIAARLSFPHFARSMNDQQGRPYGDEVAEDTDDMMREAYRFLEMMLFNGDANTNPLEFNGLQSQSILDDHVFQVDIRGVQPQRIWQTVNEIVMRATTDRETLRRITHVFTTGAAYVAIQQEAEAFGLKLLEKEVVPGLNVPSIMTGDGEKPIISSPYLDDLANVSGHDVLRVYLLDINAVEWHGVYPFGGERSLEPQIFDVTNYLNGEYLVTERMLLLYGTPYLKNNGLYRIDILAPLGSAWNIS